LNVLAALFPSLRAEFPDLELQVYSSMKVYQQEDQDASYAGLYQQCRTTPGIRYVGSVGQKALAEALRGVSILSYPNTFAETACIAVMEALAAGAYVVSSDLGALPETSMGFATLVPPGPYADLTQFGSVFREYLAAVLRRWRQDPAGFAAGRFAQVQQINASCTWKVRAREWEETILGWQRQQQRHVVVR
jgi:glycosyltransferase involved in cell wall biosynthesis